MVWQRLNECYGNNFKIVDYVLSDIRKLKPISEGKHLKLILMINAIEKTWLDLMSGGLSH